MALRPRSPIEPTNEPSERANEVAVGTPADGHSAAGHRALRSIPPQPDHPVFFFEANPCRDLCRWTGSGPSRNAPKPGQRLHFGVFRDPTRMVRGNRRMYAPGSMARRGSARLRRGSAFACHASPMATGLGVVGSNRKTRDQSPRVGGQPNGRPTGRGQSVELDQLKKESPVVRPAR